MARDTTIAWTDHTFNPWEGCTPVSPGCDHCYAETRDKRHQIEKADHWGKGAPRRMTADSNWRQPLKWNRDAARAGISARVFCGSLCDVMDDEAPSGARERLWKLIDQTPNLNWLLLTKRPHRFERYLPEEFKHGNVWLGVSAENQHFCDVRWPILHAAARRHHAISFISYEPALGPLSIAGFASRPNWIICGGETDSHSHFRAIKPEWAEALCDECRLYSVAFFMKQMSARTPKQAADLIPAELLIREWPANRSRGGEVNEP